MKQPDRGSSVTSETLRLNLGEFINRVLYRSERVRVTRRGKPVMALVPVQDLEILEKVMDAVGDEADADLVGKRLEEMLSGGQAVAWEKVKADCGL